MNLTSVLANVSHDNFTNLNSKEKDHLRTRNRVKGVLIGLASADRIGGPTKMALILASSLIKNQGFDEEDLTRLYLKWWDTSGYDAGNVCKKVFEYSLGGLNIRDAVLKVNIELDGMTAGCNPVHRNAVLPMLSIITDTELSSLALKESSLTHKHNLAGQVSALSAELIRMLINGVEWHSAILRLENISSPVMSKIIKNGLTGIINSDGFSPHVFSSAIYFVNSNDCFDEMLMKAIEFSGEDNYCAVLAGSLGGARWGASSISKYWIKGSKDSGRVIEMANQLSEGW